MPKRLHLEDHLSSKELEHHYRKAKDHILRTHLLIVWQLSEGKLTREVSGATDEVVVNYLFESLEELEEALIRTDVDLFKLDPYALGPSSHLGLQELR